LAAKQVDVHFDGIAAFADVGDFLDQSLKIYSIRMVVRLACAVLAHVDAEVLVIDEALALGDAYFVQKCIRFLRNFSAKGTLLFVSHDTSSLMGLCDRAVCLEHGLVRDIGVAKAIVGIYLEGLYRDLAVDENALRLDNEVQLEASDVGGYCDHRDQLLTNSNLRNYIRLLEFTADAADFTGGVAGIVDVTFWKTNTNSVGRSAQGR
jgi:lipopolysaccharide transport system ATP-binding protein